MPRKLIVISGKKLIGLLKKIGYKILRQKGSHIRIGKETCKGFHKITIPAHKIIAKGTINDILSDIAFWNDLSKDELINQLKYLKQQ